MSRACMIGELKVSQLGFGGMRITGPGVWGEPADRAEAIRVLRHTAELGIDFIDTADSYGPFVSEELIAQALHPYRGITVATKGGLVRTGPDQWHKLGRPEYLRQCVEMSLRRLRLETIPLYQLHRIDPMVPLPEQVGELDDMRREGKIAHIGLSQVGLRQLVEARLEAPIVSVQNRFSLADQEAADVLDYCDREGLAFIPWAPVGAGGLTTPDGPLAALASQAGATPAQLALGWLLHRSPRVVPIPGTSSVAHLVENAAAARLELTTEQLAALSSLATTEPAAAAGAAR
jgi:pyridoxine 4-dehydrogenase